MRVLYFASLRQTIGLAAEEIEPPAGVETLGQLVDWLKRRGPRHERALADMRAVRAAINQDYAGLDAPIGRDDEIAFFPPVTGG